MSSTDRPEPIRLVNYSLLLWALLIVGLSVQSATAGGSWALLGFGLGAITAGLAIWGLRQHEWVRPLFASLYVLAIGCVAAGPLTNSDVWPAIGILCITMLSIGAAILHRIAART